MNKLKLRALENDKPVTMTIKLAAAVHRDLVAYAEMLRRVGGHAIEPKSLVAPMLKQFMASDRAFRAACKKHQNKE